jgi:hypothetical protein
MRFSQRVGARPSKKSGLEEASSDLRTALWNLLHVELIPTVSITDLDTARHHVVAMWNHLHWRTDQIPPHMYQAKEQLSRHWFSCAWPELFDTFENAVVLIVPEYGHEHTRWFETLNSVFEQEGCGYRFISGQLAPLTNPTEIDEVANAAESAIPSVARHIRDALSLMPPNPESSPRNSIKESISAVEAALKHLTGKPSATLSQALPDFELKYGALHPALRAGLEKLYGYTSDEKGVRHALVGETANVTIDDARFMVVACSAFANYLVALSSAKGS